MSWIHMHNQCKFHLAKCSCEMLCTVNYKELAPVIKRHYYKTNGQVHISIQSCIVHGDVHVYVCTCVYT